MSAIDAVENVLRDFLEPWLQSSVHGTTLESQIHAAACVAVRDAAPLIAAAERERIRQLALDLGAGYASVNAAGYPYDYLPFADLLGGES